MILSIINEIASDNSKNYKLEVLKTHKDNELFQKVLKLAYCPVTQFYIRQIPEYGKAFTELGLDYALNRLSAFSNRELTGTAAKTHLSQILSSLSANDAEVIKRIIGKDLRAGFSESSINKVFGKNFIKETPYMGAVSYGAKKVEKLFKNHKRVFSEVKMDGRYSNVKITDEVFMESRGGKPTYFGDTFNNFLSLPKIFGEHVVLNGELIIPGMDRYASNGVIASIVSIYNKIEDGKNVDKEIEKFNKTYYSLSEMCSKIVLVVWDYLPLNAYEDSKWGFPREIRMERLEYFIKEANLPNLKFVEYKEVSNVSEAMTHFKEMLSRGEEGTILKGGDNIWKDGKPTSQVKFKLEMTVDLEIISFNYGTGKNSELISSLNVKSSCGLLTTSPTGINEKTMKMITKNQESLKGTIVEVKCSGLSSDSTGAYSLLHPVYVDLRTDEKIVADTLDQIKENENMIKELK